MKNMLMMAVAALMVMACGKRVATEGAAGSTAVFNVEEGRVSSRIVADVPEPALRTAVGEWMNDMLGGYYDGDVNDMQAMVDFYGKATMDSLKVWAGDVRPELGLNYEATAVKAYETPQYVTYTLSTYLNLGGAHPTSGEEGTTFRKSDGRRLTWDIIRRDKQYLFSQMVTGCLKDYFGMDDEELQQVLGDNVYFNPPLPRTPPFLLENGMVLIYQQYEIAGYAMGMPCDTIGYDRLVPLLTVSARRLVNE